MQGPRYMAGPSEDALTNAIATTFANALSASVTGAPGTKQRETSVGFFSDVLAKTGEKFVETPGGKSTVNKFLFLGIGGGVLLGLALGYLLYKK